jgi:hypothetical protein
LAQALVVRIRDADGRAVPEQPVTFAVTAGGGSVSASSTSTDSDGDASTEWTLGTVAGNTQVVEVQVLDAQTNQPIFGATFTGTGEPDTPASVQVRPATAADSAVLIASDTMLTGDMLTLATVAVDQYGNVVTEFVPIWMSSNPAGAAVTQGGVVTALTAGTVVISASIGPAGGDFPLVIQLRLPAALVLVAGSLQSDTVDAVLGAPVVVRAVDQRGAPFEGAIITFTGTNAAPTDTTAGCSCRIVTTDASGLASTEWVLGVNAGQATLLATGLPPMGGTAFDSVTVVATVRHGAANNLVRIAGGGAATSLIVAVRDRYGNPVSGTVVSWAITSGVGTLLATASITDINGFGATSVSGSGTVTVTASVQGLIGSPVVFTVTISAVAPNFALDFNQSWVTIPDHADLDLGATFTLEAWIRPSNVNLSAFQHIISKWDGSGNSSYTLEINRGRLRSAIHDALNPTQVVESKGTLQSNVWQHVAVTLNNGMLSLYINGSLDTTFTGSQTPMNSDRAMSLGREGPPFGGWRYDGILDEVRIWNVARSAAQIAVSKDVGLRGSETGLVAYFRFNTGSGDVAFDLTGRGHNGQLGSVLGADANDPTWTTDAAPVP